MNIINDTFTESELVKVQTQLSKTRMYNYSEDNIPNFYGVNLSPNVFDNVIDVYKKCGVLIDNSQIDTFTLQKIENTKYDNVLYRHRNKDISKRALTFLGDNYDDVLFEYKINGIVKTIKPKKNMTLFFDGSIEYSISSKNQTIMIVLFLNEFSEYKKTKTVI